MEKGEKFQSFGKLRIDPEQSRMGQREKIGTPEYVNENCWLAKTINYPPAERCRYCELKFRHCLFFQYLITSLILILFLFTLSFLIEGKISKLLIISIFVLVIVYGRFFNKSTEKIIKAYFAQKKAKEALKELAEGLEVQVEQRTKEIQKLSNFKTELLSIVAHQIKNPLATIKGYASLVEDKTISGPEAIMDVFKKIKASAGKLITLLNNLLDFHRLEEGKMHYDFQKLELNKLLKDMVEGFQIVAQQRNLDLIFESSSSEVYVNGDISKLSQVFQNLIDNAIKYTEKGFVKVAITRTDTDDTKSVLISISDSGRGMSQDLTQKLFQKFSRGTEEIKTYGSGLGLYISKEIVEAHQGKIWAESEGENKGSSFFVELPIIN